MKPALPIIAATLAATMSASLPAVAAPPGGCPPGLANKGCVPPGHAKRDAPRYHIGDRFPDDYAYRRIRDYERYGLPRPRQGTMWVQVDDRYILLDTTLRIIDLLTR